MTEILITSSVLILALLGLRKLRGIDFGPAVALIADRPLGLQPGEHGDDGVLAPAGAVSQHPGESSHLFPVT